MLYCFGRKSDIHVYKWMASFAQFFVFFQGIMPHYLLIELCYVSINMFFFLIDKPENVQLTTNTSANKACQSDMLELTCSVGDANPEVTSYHLFRNDTDLGESNTGIWVKTLSNSGLLMYKCVANNSVGSSESRSVSITVNGNHEFRFSSPPLLTLPAEPFFYFTSFGLSPSLATLDLSLVVRSSNPRGRL